jgi:CheY-like chemotaxis protein/HPt (histidine-containing phosphotransfer) domain-containing protein
MNCPQRETPVLKRDTTLNILSVEDNKSLEFIIACYLIDAGHTVKNAETGAIALELALREPFDAVLMNVSMPDMSSVDFVNTVRSPQSINRDVFILAISGNSTKLELEGCFSAGINSCLAKPVTKMELIAALKVAQERRSGSTLLERSFEGGRFLTRPLICVSALRQFVAARPLPRALKTIEIFSAELKERTESLRSVIDREDADGLRFVAHSLIGAAELLGAASLADMSRRVERDLKIGRPFEGLAATDLLSVAVKTSELFEAVKCERSLRELFDHPVHYIEQSTRTKN